MILLIGFGTERTFAHVVAGARARSAAFQVLDLSRVCDAEQVEVEECGGLVIRVDGEVFDFGRYEAAFQRAFVTQTGRPEADARLAEVVQSARAYLRFAEYRVVNRPGAGDANGSKLRQLLELRDFGFRVPATFVGNHPFTAWGRMSPDGRWISKGVSSIRTEVAAVDRELYGRLQRLEHCPSLFQERIVGADARVHVIGERVIGVRVDGDAVDYRYPGEEPLEWSELEVPPGLAADCVSFCARAGLDFAGVDFKLSGADGDPYVLEVNPMPGFDYFDRKLGGPIVDALLDHLGEPPRPGSPLAEPPEPLIGSERRPNLSPL